MSTGAFIGDAIREIEGTIASVVTSIYGGDGAFSTDNFGGITTHDPAGPLAFEKVLFKASRVVPTALETRGASVSVFACVTY
jgi:hypothetical protein